MELDQAAVDAWMSANTLAELGELTARWLEGSLSFNPGYGGPPNGETTDLIPALARFNRAGFVTENSQPGEDTDQRACVSGFCNEQTAETIAAVCMPTDLICVFCWPGTESYLHIPVTLDEGAAFTWAGMSIDGENITYVWADSCSASAVDALVGAYQVWVIDPIWGRNDLLWATVDRALAGPPLTGALPDTSDTD